MTSNENNLEGCEYSRSEYDRYLHIQDKDAVKAELTLALQDNGDRTLQQNASDASKVLLPLTYFENDPNLEEKIQNALDCLSSSSSLSVSP